MYLQVIGGFLKRFLGQNSPLFGPKLTSHRKLIALILNVFYKIFMLRVIPFLKGRKQ
jgi:hypothetical protein